MSTIPEVIGRVLPEVRPYTGVPDEGVAWTIQLALESIENHIPGDLVECGTWMGGCSFAMLLAQRYYFGEIVRPVWMYDSFEGMSEPTDEDGYRARWWMKRALETKDEGAEKQKNWCIAPLEQVVENAGRLGLGEYVRIIPGWLNKTLPAFKPQRISVLRVDCDFYAPVKCVLEELVPHVSQGGPIIMDDYEAWEGCVLATHEYLAKHSLPWRIRTVPGLNGAWIIKGPPHVIAPPWGQA
jgi:O-methyltransferase